MTQLAALMGQVNFQSANSQYGRLGGMLVASLGVPKPKWLVYAIASFDDNPESGKRRARMHPELSQALLQLGWITQQDFGGAITGQPGKGQGPVSGVHQVSLRAQDVIAALEGAGFSRPEQSGLKVVRLSHPALTMPVFVKQSASETPLVLHPKYEEHLSSWLSIQGVEKGQAPYYHNSNLRGFPKRRNTGATDISYGIDLGFLGLGALDEFIRQLLDQTGAVDGAPTTPKPLLPQCFSEELPLTDTEREALIKARIGQNGYREALLAYWGGCAVTDCCVPELLRASHIKPWRAASSSERLDPFNGLLLTPNLDLAFDQGLISFDEDGLILLSSDLDPASIKALHLTPQLCLRQLETRHRGYLAWHREHLFRA
ncbi:HNH endonuclease [Pseudomonas sp. GD04087]|uniref:HNH endonuclease n=1 Tax=Pseudomonas TaxID=286 RepID=UPI001EE109EE|nr:MULTISPECIES: HNH endonuclease [Pseudomonas]MDH0291326.1 HNH endonuclease [Pseudomonas sp. GD04087]MDH1052654.1 HNH endonuclease [Pseudomonas sp. GD03903]MDH2001561.1 HNH endonuclease [Pseudomonas sp. GD03691]MDU4255602.1 HNH endonuclease [Pseudomonas sp.]